MKIISSAFAAKVNRFSADIELSHFFTLHGGFVYFLSQYTAACALSLFKARRIGDFEGDFLYFFCDLL